MSVEDGWHRLSCWMSVLRTENCGHCHSDMFVLCFVV